MNQLLRGPPITRTRPAPESALGVTQSSCLDNSAGVLKPAPRLSHPHNLLYTQTSVPTKTAKPPETFPQTGRERARETLPGGSPWGC